MVSLALSYTITDVSWHRAAATKRRSTKNSCQVSIVAIACRKDISDPKIDSRASQVKKDLMKSQARSVGQWNG